MPKIPTKNLAYREVFVQRPYEIEDAVSSLSQLATMSTRSRFVWEIVKCGFDLRHHAIVDASNISKIEQICKTDGKVRLIPADEPSYHKIDTVRQITLSSSNLSLNLDDFQTAIKAGIAAFASVHEDDEMAMQIIIQRAIPPHSTPKNISDPNATLLETVVFGRNPASNDIRKTIKEKNDRISFEVYIRVGVSGGRVDQINQVLSAFKTLEAPGIHFSMEPEDPEHLRQYIVPNKHPMRLSVKELAVLLLLPYGEKELPGVTALHPKTTTLPAWYQEPKDYRYDRTFAICKDEANPKRLSFGGKDMLTHAVILGGTGVGKSTLMLHQIIADIEAGKSVLVVDPKNDLIRDVLERLPEKRLDDVVVIDASDARPVGFNPLDLPGEPELITDAIIAVFKNLFPDNMGIRSLDILSAGLLTLLRTNDSNLLWLPAMLTDENFRAAVLEDIEDDVVLTPFWKQFNAMKESERKQEIAPALNKLRQFLYRPGLRAVLGQEYSAFRLEDLFFKRKVVLVPLNKGVIGAESARLLGSLIVSLTWTLALMRANIPPEKRHIVSMYIDELQDYIALPTDLSDTLAQARGLGVAITMAHQYRGQLPAEIRSGIDANCRNKICFTLSASDAKDMAAMAPELEAEDFMNLPQYEIYTTFQAGGRSSGWVRGATLPPTKPIRNASSVLERNRRYYGTDRSKVDQHFMDLFRQCESEPPADYANTVFGGRRKP